MEELISVIVPVYKVEQYLDRCVKSIVNQTYQKIEIILVDDGSPDNCPIMCDNWVKKDCRIRVIHKENGGLSDARNAGIEIAQGKYIAFVDSDDYVHPMFIEILYYFIKKENADVVACLYEKTSCAVYPKEFNNIDYKKVARVENAEEGYLMYEGVVAWNKLYKKTIFDEIRFPVGRIHEDNGIIWKIRYYTKRIILIREILYYYFENASGIMKSSLSIKCLDKPEVYYQQYLYFKEKKQYKYASKILEWCLNCYPTIYYNLKKEDKKVKEAFCNSYRSKVSTALREREINKKTKIKHLIYSTIPTAITVFSKKNFEK